MLLIVGRPGFVILKDVKVSSEMSLSATHNDINMMTVEETDDKLYVG
jgi:hypothetical protein